MKDDLLQGLLTPRVSRLLSERSESHDAIRRLAHNPDFIELCDDLRFLDDQINAICTPEQRARFAELKKCLEEELDGLLSSAAAASGP